MEPKILASHANALSSALPLSAAAFTFPAAAGAANLKLAREDLKGGKA